MENWILLFWLIRCEIQSDQTVILETVPAKFQNQIWLGNHVNMPVIKLNSIAKCLWEQLPSFELLFQVCKAKAVKELEGSSHSSSSPRKKARPEKDFDRLFLLRSIDLEKQFLKVALKSDSPLRAVGLPLELAEFSFSL